MRSLGGAVPQCFTVTETWQGLVSGRPLVFPGQHFEVDAHGILIVRPARRAPEAVR